MVPLNAGWSDVGAWDAVLSITPKDSNGNAALGDVILEDAHNSLIYASSRLVTCAGIDKLVVVETPDAVLVAGRDSVQDVKKIVAGIKNQGRLRPLNIARYTGPGDGMTVSIAASNSRLSASSLIRVQCSASSCIITARSTGWLFRERRKLPVERKSFFLRKINRYSFPAVANTGLQIQAIFRWRLSKSNMVHISAKMTLFASKIFMAAAVKSLLENKTAMNRC